MPSPKRILDLVAGGSYLTSRHTKKHFRNTWYPDLFERGPYLDWVKKGSRSLIERASERVQMILQEHQPEPHPESTSRRLREIVQQAEAGKISFWKRSRV